MAIILLQALSTSKYGPLVFHKRKSASGTLREENGLTVFENRVLRKRNEVTGGWIRLHNEELHQMLCG